MNRSKAVTRGVRVEVESAYSPERSRPDDDEYFFTYTVRIANDGSDVVQLVTRHWIITDANGREQEVRGPGVVGEQPVLAPGESFEYTSGCPLATPFGSMRGSYQMKTPSGAGFDAEIAAFTLSQPYAMN
jgi:ApaG protein